MKPLIRFFVLFLSVNVCAQTNLFRTFPLDSDFAQMYWGTSHEITRAADGGYYVSYQFANGLYAFNSQIGEVQEVIKTDSLFVPEWKHFLSDFHNEVYTFPMADSSVIVALTDYEALLEKLNASGEVCNKHYYMKNNSTYPTVYSYGAISFNSGVEFAGVLSYGYPFVTYRCGFLLDVDTSGSIVSADSIVVQGMNMTSIEGLATDNSGNRFIAGSDYQFSGEGFLVKLNSNNTVAWCKKINPFNNTNSLPFIRALKVLSNGDILLGVNGDGSWRIYRFDMNGNLLWSEVLSPTAWLGGITELPGGNILASGAFRAFSGDTATGLIMEIDPNGNMIWNKRTAPAFEMGPAYILSTGEYIFPTYTCAPTIFSSDNTGNTNCFTASFPLSFSPISASVSNGTCLIYPTSFISISQLSYPARSQPFLDTCISAPFTTTIIPASSVKTQFEITPNPSQGLFAVTNIE
ncbi:MAG TPA: hypothetical protein VL651_00620, partial [Bacteroidia bacterium]|nr:hypothetical protein [Bacteroidia bacterium]